MQKAPCSMCKGGVLEEVNYEFLCTTCGFVFCNLFEDNWFNISSIKGTEADKRIIVHKTFYLQHFKTVVESIQGCQNVKVNRNFLYIMSENVKDYSYKTLKKFLKNIGRPDLYKNIYLFINLLTGVSYKMSHIIYVDLEKFFKLFVNEYFNTFIDTNFKKLLPYEFTCYCLMEEIEITFKLDFNYLKELKFWKERFYTLKSKTRAKNKVKFNKVFENINIYNLFCYPPYNYEIDKLEWLDLSNKIGKLANKIPEEHSEEEDWEKMFEDSLSNKN
jgi:hypothetical protein